MEIKKVKEMRTIVARSLDNMLDEVFDRITAEGYLLQRGDLQYQEVAEATLCHLDNKVLDKLMAIDDRITFLLETYEVNRDPKKLDFFILSEKERLLREAKERIMKIEEAFLKKLVDPRKDLERLHRKIEKSMYKNELEGASLNNKYKDIVKFLEGFISGCENSEDSYLSNEIRTKAIYMIDKLIDFSEKQFEDRLSRLEQLKGFFDE